MDINAALVRAARASDGHIPGGCHHLRSFVELREGELQVASEDGTVHPACLQDMAVVKIVCIVERRDMAVLDLIPGHIGGHHRVDDHRIHSFLRRKPSRIRFQSHIRLLVLLSAVIRQGQCQAVAHFPCGIRHIRCRQPVNFPAICILKDDICTFLSGL